MRRRHGSKEMTSDSTDDSTIVEEEVYQPTVRALKFGVWDIVVDKPVFKFKLPSLTNLVFSSSYIPYIQRFILDLIKTSPGLLGLWFAASCLNSLVPALSLYWSSQVLQLIQAAVDEKSFDQERFIRVALIRILCLISGQLLSYIIQNVCEGPVSFRVGQFFEEHLLEAYIRLDPVTLNDPIVQQQLERVSPRWSSGRHGASWRALSSLVTIILSGTQILSQISVLAGLIYQHEGGGLFLAVTVVGPALRWCSGSSTPFNWNRSFYGISRDENYLHLKGLHQLAFDPGFRDDIMYCDAQSYILKKYRYAKAKLGFAAIDFYEALNSSTWTTSPKDLVLNCLVEACKSLPEVLFAFSAAQAPASFSLSLTWLTLLGGTVDAVSATLGMMSGEMRDLEEKLRVIKSLYTTAEIKNQIVDGSESYSAGEVSVPGMSLEFRDVHFKYPGSEKWVLRGVSFTIEPGQLCIIVGRNGSGKSSTVKLLSRLQDCQKGQILIDGRPIQSLRLSDYRRCLSILPQGFTHFPLTVAENIGIGDPSRADDKELIRRSAELGGALELIENDLPDGFETRLKGPDVFHMYSEDPRWNAYAEKEAKIKRNPDLSGGQWQRLALARTFMRTSDNTRLLCYDEPSAALDPISEYELFQQLRQLRQQKTLVFVTHRFGHLTRYADKIIYLEDGRVLEQGTHAELLAKDGAYANMYRLQAEAFAPQ